MALAHRNLVSELCDPYCVNSNESTLSNPPSEYDYYPPPSPPPGKASLPLILDIFIAGVFAGVLLLTVYAFYLRRRRSRTRNPTRPDEFLDQDDHVPVIDHHVWYINTIGLHQSLVDSIAVVRYDSGVGLVGGTECSVCLTDFRQDEALRLLPKCSHAFHIDCIDTWLRSHTNCPICRAPIVSDHTIPNLETQISDSDDRRTEEARYQARDRARSQTIRRSFSLGFNPLPEELDRSSETQIVKSRNRVVMNRSRSGSGSSSRSMMRSVSCSGQLFSSSRNSRSRSSVLPL